MVNNPGDVVRVRLALGAGPINGGTQVTINKIRFDMDCNADDPLGIGCTDEGDIVEYLGDATITTTCVGIAFATDPAHSAGPDPNQLEFVATPTFTIPANTADFCAIEFDVRILSQSVDSTPARIEQVAGFDANENDAECDNDLMSGVSQSAFIALCSDCGPTTTTTSSTTTTTLLGCSPPDSSAMKCETAIAKAAAQLVKRVVNCSIADARALVGSDPPVELSADGDACEAKAAARFDQGVAKIAEKIACPPSVLANVPTLRAGALAQTGHMLDLIFVCPAP
jgi:hypothetical protein